MSWFRHQGDSRWHTGAPDEHSYITLCNGRWSLTDVEQGVVEQHDSPPVGDRCGYCDLAHENRRLRAELEVRTNELHLAERELAEAQAPRKLSADAECARLEVALLEAVEIALRAGRRGFITPVEHQRCGALMRLVPQ